MRKRCGNVIFIGEILNYSGTTTIIILKVKNKIKEHGKVQSNHSYHKTLSFCIIYKIMLYLYMLFYGVG